MIGFRITKRDENFEHKLDKDFGLFAMVVPLEKVDKLRLVHPLGSCVSLQNRLECLTYP